LNCPPSSYDRFLLGIILSQKIVDSLRHETAAVRGGHNAD
jgi:hypothetical protein